jgi:hypothetical protein
VRKTILACLAIAMIVGATSATAATLITSSQIKDGTIQNRDIKRGAVSLNRLTDGTQNLIRRGAAQNTSASSSQPGAQGAQGPGGQNGAKGDKGDTGANGKNGTDGADGTDAEDGEDGAPGRDGANPAVPVRNVGDEGWIQSNAAAPAALKWGELYFEGDARTGLRKNIASVANPNGIACLPSALKYFFRVDQRAAGLKTAPAIKLEVRGAARQDATTSTFTTLILEPTYQPLRDAAREGEINGLAPGNKWWSTNPISGAPNRDTFVSIQDICAANPGAHIDAILFEAGSGNGAGFAAGGDELLFNDTRYDFGG